MPGKRAPAALPPVHITGAVVRAETPVATLVARVDGSVWPDLSGSFQVAVDEVRVAFAGRTFRGERLAARVSLSPGGGDVRAVLTGGRLVDTHPSPWFDPVGLGGEATYDGEAVRLRTVASMAGGRVRLNADGHHRLADGRGSAKLAVAEIRFEAGGLQPSDLAPQARPLKRVSGRIEGRAALSWDADGVAGEGQLDAGGFSFVVGDTKVEALDAIVAATLDGGRIHVEVGAARGQATRWGQALHVADAAFALTLDPVADALLVEGARATLGHGGASAWFAPLAVEGGARLQDGKLEFECVVAAAGRRRVTVEGRHDLRSGNGRADLVLVPLTFAPGGLRVRDLVPVAGARAESVSGTVAARATAEWVGGKLGAEVEATLEGGALEAGDLRVRDAGARIRAVLKPGDGGVSLALAEGRARLAVAGHRVRIEALEAGAETVPGNGPVSVTVSGATLRHEAGAPRLAPLRLNGSARIEGTAVVFNAHLAPVARPLDPAAAVDGRIDASAASGRARVRLGPYRFDRLFQPRDLLPGLDMVSDVSGGASADVDLGWTGAGVDGTLALELDSLSFATDTVAVVGLAGTVRLDRLAPPATAGPQVLRARRIEGPVSLDAPQASFRVEPAGADGVRLHVEAARAGFAGGTVAVEGAVIDPAAAANRVTLRLAGVDLGQLLGLIGEEGVAGSGTIEGAVPLEFRADTVLVTGALLEARGGGVLRLRSAAAKRALAAAGEQVGLLVDVLEDFRYEALSLALDKGAEGDALMRLSTRGHNPAVLDGHPFVLNVNLSANIDRLLAVALESYRLSDRAIRATFGGRRKRAPEEPM